ncbi:MAG: DUF861 domain-containing protein [Alphaproteobacteria bacterium]|nr:DUF861 domain-containing protein [Alphaproteobacteria bacterium]
MIASATNLPLTSAPITPSWVRSGSPAARNAVLSCSADGMATTIVWDCTAGEFEWTYTIDETIYFLEGSAVITDGHAPPRRFGPGDVLFLPRGTVARWQIENYVRKVAFCRKSPPALVTIGLRAARKVGRIKRRLTAARPKESDALATALTA